MLNVYYIEEWSLIDLEHKAESTPRAELSGADDVNKTREGRETH